MGNTKILIVGPSFDILGGQAVQVGRLLDRLKLEPSVEVGFLPINPRLPRPLRKLQSIKFVRTIVTSAAYCASLLSAVPKFDVVHVFSASYFSFLLAPAPAILISKLFGRKVVLNYHSGEAADHLRKWPSAIRTLQRADRLVVPSEYLEGVFKEFGLEAIPIHNIVEIDRFKFRSRNPLRPLFLSNRNFERHYGVDQVLRAFKLIQNQFPTATLVVAGDGPERKSLERLAFDLGIQNTKFTGKVPHGDILDLYDSADVFINGSMIDNQPLSILEAFACGLPVVTTNAGGIPYMVQNERTGLVVPCNDPEALAKAAMRLFAEPELAQQLICEGRKECIKYSWTAVRDAWLGLYEDTAHARGSGGTNALNKKHQVAN